jgi:phage tail-like protein
MNYYPPIGYHFSVEFGEIKQSADGKTASLTKDSNFKEVSGLTSEIPVDKYQEGGVNDQVHPLPKPAQFTNITLKRGMLVDSSLIQWMNDAIENFIFKPTTITIKLLDNEHHPLAAWEVSGAYPIKWEVSGFNSMDNAIVIESVEFACQKHRRLPLDVKSEEPQAYKRTSPLDKLENKFK